MPSRDWKFRIQDIIDSITKIEKYLDGLDIKKFKKNPMVIDAVVRNLEIIGESSNHLPKSVKDNFPTIPWNQMKGLRNILIHEYFGIDTETVWYTATKHLTSLKKELSKIQDYKDLSE